MWGFRRCDLALAVCTLRILADASGAKHVTRPPIHPWKRGKQEHPATGSPGAAPTHSYLAITVFCVLLERMKPSQARLPETGCRIAPPAMSFSVLLPVCLSTRVLPTHPLRPTQPFSSLVPVIDGTLKVPGAPSHASHLHKMVVVRASWVVPRMCRTLATVHWEVGPLHQPPGCLPQVFSACRRWRGSQGCYKATCTVAQCSPSPACRHTSSPGRHERPP